jgi:hypothetical protein
VPATIDKFPLSFPADASLSFKGTESRDVEPRINPDS